MSIADSGLSVIGVVSVSLRPRAKLKADALFRDLSIRQAENLKSAGIRQDCLIPPHHGMQATKSLNNLSPIKDAQVVGIGENDLSPSGGDLVRQHTLDGSLGSHRHERRCFDRAVSRDEATAASPATAGQQLIMQPVAGRPLRR